MTAFDRWAQRQIVQNDEAWAENSRIRSNRFKCGRLDDLASQSHSTRSDQLRRDREDLDHLCSLGPRARIEWAERVIAESRAGLATADPGRGVMLRFRISLCEAAIRTTRGQEW